MFRLPSTDLALPPSSSLTILQKIGEGSYGAVFKALHKTSGTLIAVKSVPVEEESEMDSIVKEINVMEGCVCEYIVQYFGSWLVERSIWVSKNDKGQHN
jgi:serine/threonine protein kinase